MKRHVCIYCGAKRYEKEMIIIARTKNNRPRWFCKNRSPHEKKNINFDDNILKNYENK
jgi:hypothetical protein